jgi:hypothetical protein
VRSGAKAARKKSNSEVLQPVERTFDAPRQLVETLAEAERLLPVTSVGNDRLVQLLAQFGTVVGLVAEYASWRLCSPDQTLSDWTIVCLASGQKDSNEASFSICECVNLRVAPSTRAANSLLLLPPFRLPLSDALSRAWSRSSACLWRARSQQAPGTGFPRFRAAPSARSDYRPSSEVRRLPGNRANGSHS